MWAAYFPHVMESHTYIVKAEDALLEAVLCSELWSTISLKIEINQYIIHT